MQDSVGFCKTVLQMLDCLSRWKYEEFNVSVFGAPLHFVHDRERPPAGADHKPAALPGYLFIQGQRRMPKSVPIFSGRLLFPLVNLPPIDDHVVFVGNAINADRTEGKIFKSHRSRAGTSTANREL